MTGAKRRNGKLDQTFTVQFNTPIAMLGGDVRTEFVSEFARVSDVVGRTRKVDQLRSIARTCASEIDRLTRVSDRAEKEVKRLEELLKERAKQYEACAKDCQNFAGKLVAEQREHAETKRKLSIELRDGIAMIAESFARGLRDK